MSSDQLLRLGLPLGPRIKLLDAMQRYSILFHSISWYGVLLRFSSSLTRLLFSCFRPPPATESWPPLPSSAAAAASSLANGHAASSHLGLNGTTLSAMAAGGP
jgi:hypothetical protein